MFNHSGKTEIGACSASPAKYNVHNEWHANSGLRDKLRCEQKTDFAEFKASIVDWLFRG